MDNIDVRVLCGDGDRAARLGDLDQARACFLEAARCAEQLQLWRAAVRCYRSALELDLLDRELVNYILKLPLRVISGRGWDEYRSALEAHSGWVHFGCRSARVVLGDLGAVIECPAVGPVLELFMTERDLVETRADVRFQGMPIAMAMIVLRRAMWSSPRDAATELASVRVTYAGHQRVRLDERGDWDPIIEART